MNAPVSFSEMNDSRYEASERALTARFPSRVLRIEQGAKNPSEGI